MRSKRLIKKLSKALAPMYRDVWRCSDNEELYFFGDIVRGTSAKGVLHVGGGTDYWGEAEDAYTVLEMAEHNFYAWKSYCGCQACDTQFDPDCPDEICEVVERRMKLRPTLANIKAAMLAA